MVDLFSMLLRLYIIVVSIFFSVTKSLVTLTHCCYDYLMHLQHWSLSVLFCFHMKFSKYVFQTSISLIYNIIIMLDRLLLHKHAICFRNCVIVLKTPSDSFDVVSFNVNLWETSCQDCYILSLMNVMCVQLVIFKKKI